MKHIIDAIDFYELEAMKYHAYPASWGAERQKTDVLNKIMSGDWYGSQKRDGFFMKFIKDEDGNITFTGRSKSVSGDYIDKWEWVPQLHEWGATVPNGTCFIGEIYWVGNEGSKNVTSIMNCLKEKAIARQAKEENKLHFYIFDILAYCGQSYLKIPALNRFNKVEELGSNNKFAYTEYAKYYNGKELWWMLQDLLAQGYEGMVITQKDAFYEPGKRPSKTTKKVKQELRQTIDCVVIGANAPTVDYTGKDPYNWQYWLNSITGEKLEGHYFREAEQGGILKPVTKNYFYNWAGSLKLGLYKNGNLTYIGDVSGISDEIKENWRAYVGKVAEVGGMMITRDATGTAAIRHPKFLGWRDEKPAEECTYDQLDQ